MKKLLLTAMLLMAVSFGFAQVPQGAKTYEKNGKIYVEIKEKPSKKDYKPLGFWATYEGVDYEVHSKVDKNKESKTYGQTLYYVLIPDSTKKQGFKAQRVEISKD